MYYNNNNIYILLFVSLSPKSKAKDKAKDRKRSLNPSKINYHHYLILIV